MSATEVRAVARTPSRPRASRQRLVLIMVVCVAVAGVVTCGAVVHSTRLDLRRQPLQAAATAGSATNQPILAVSATLADRWSEVSGPRLAVLMEHIGTGNHLLEPAFYQWFARDEGISAARPGSSGRCEYLAVQRKSGPLQVDQVTRIVRVCYQASSDSALSWTEASLE